MKLKNKKTGEIKEFNNFYELEEPSGAQRVYCSIAELNQEWEDYEEPEIIWYINASGEVCCAAKENYWGGSKQIGNYFETKEEAEKAVEKLKAWKRLKDKGFKFIDHIDRDSGQCMTRYKWDGYVNGEDLDLLFGGEE